MHNEEILVMHKEVILTSYNVLVKHLQNEVKCYYEIFQANCMFLIVLLSKYCNIKTRPV